MRRAAKRDENEPAVIGVFEAAGGTVQPLSIPGGPDLLVGLRQRTLLVEVKDGAKVESRRRLTRDQKRWHEWWQGSPVHVVRSVDDALRLLKGA